MTNEMEEAARQYLRDHTFLPISHNSAFEGYTLKMGTDELLADFALKAVSDREKEIVRKLRECATIPSFGSAFTTETMLENIARWIERGE